MQCSKNAYAYYGELLIDTPMLSDNARRDWFRLDSSAIELRIVLNDYLKKLKAYRYAASNAFNDKSSDEKRKNLVSTFKELTNGFDSKEFERSFYEHQDIPNDKPILEYAENDIPSFSISNRKFYEKVVIALKEYYLKSDSGINEFIKIRTYLKKYFNNSDN